MIFLEKVKRLPKIVYSYKCLIAAVSNDQNEPDVAKSSRPLDSVNPIYRENWICPMYVIPFYIGL